MDARVPPRLSAREGRRFALTLAVAFAAVGAVLWWRDHQLPMTGALAIAGLLAGAGIVVPTRLAPLQKAWMGLALAISKVTTPIFLGVLYFGAFLPTGLIRRALGRDSLARSSRSSFWVVRPPGERKSDLHRQF